MTIELISCMRDVDFDNALDIHFGCKFRLNDKIVMVELVRSGPWSDWDVKDWCRQSGWEAVKKLEALGLEDFPSGATILVWKDRRAALHKPRSTSAPGSLPELIAELPGRLSAPAASPD